MKKYFILIISSLIVFSKAQVSGNANYSSNEYRINEKTIPKTTVKNSTGLSITIKGIYNAKATTKVAVFSVLQSGKSAEETDNLLEKRLQSVISELHLYDEKIEPVTDMISFVPMFEYEQEKKTFSPKTYNEKPSGFELRKNLIIKFKNISDLDKIMTICAKQEIYDLSKVDYLLTDYDNIRNEIQSKAMEEYKKSLSYYSTIMNMDLTKKEKMVEEGFSVVYPMENYTDYQAFSQSNPNFSKRSVVNSSRKNTTQFYDGALIKTNSFIINPEIIEPCIQIFYEMIVSIVINEKQEPSKNYYIIATNGDVISLPQPK